MSQPFVPAYDNVVEHTLDDSEGWPGMLADKMGVKLINLAGAGNSNFEMIYKFLTNCQHMKKRDTAIFQFMGWDLNKVFPFNLEMSELGFDNIQKLGGWDKVSFINKTHVIDAFIKNVIPILEQKKVNYKVWFTNEDNRNFHIINNCWSNCLTIPNSDTLVSTARSMLSDTPIGPFADFTEFNNEFDRIAKTDFESIYGKLE